MDISFNNVLEDARQYFQGLPSPVAATTTTPSTTTGNSVNPSHYGVDPGSQLSLPHPQPASSAPTPPTSSASASVLAYWPSQSSSGTVFPKSKESSQSVSQQQQMLTHNTPETKSSSTYAAYNGNRMTNSENVSNYERQEPVQTLQQTRPQGHNLPPIAAISNYHSSRTSAKANAHPAAVSKTAAQRTNSEYSLPSQNSGHFANSNGVNHGSLPNMMKYEYLRTTKYPHLATAVQSTVIDSNKHLTNQAVTTSVNEKSSSSPASSYYSMSSHHLSQPQQQQPPHQQLHQTQHYQHHNIQQVHQNHQPVQNHPSVHNHQHLQNHQAAQNHQLAAQNHQQSTQNHQPSTQNHQQQSYSNQQAIHNQQQNQNHPQQSYQNHPQVLQNHQQQYANSSHVRTSRTQQFQAETSKQDQFPQPRPSTTYSSSRSYYMSATSTTSTSTSQIYSNRSITSNNHQSSLMMSATSVSTSTAVCNGSSSKNKRESPLDLSVKAIRAADSTAKDDSENGFGSFSGFSPSSLIAKATYIGHTPQAIEQSPLQLPSSMPYSEYDSRNPRLLTSSSSVSGIISGNTSAPKVDFLPNFSASHHGNVQTVSQSADNSRQMHRISQNHYQTQYQQQVPQPNVQIPASVPHVSSSKRTVSNMLPNSHSHSVLRDSRQSQYYLPQRQLNNGTVASMSSSSLSNYPASINNSCQMQSNTDPTKRSSGIPSSYNTNNIEYSSHRAVHNNNSSSHPYRSKSHKRGHDSHKGLSQSKVPRNTETWRQVIEDQIEQSFSNYIAEKAQKEKQEQILREQQIQKHQLSQVQQQQQQQQQQQSVNHITQNSVGPLLQEQHYMSHQRQSILQHTGHNQLLQQQYQQQQQIQQQHIHQQQIQQQQQQQQHYQIQQQHQQQSQHHIQQQLNHVQMSNQSRNSNQLQQSYNQHQHPLSSNIPEYGVSLSHHNLSTHTMPQTVLSSPRGGQLPPPRGNALQKLLISDTTPDINGEIKLPEPLVAGGATSVSGGAASVPGGAASVAGGAASVTGAATSVAGDPAAGVTGDIPAISGNVTDKTVLSILRNSLEIKEARMSQLQQQLQLNAQMRQQNHVQKSQSTPHNVSPVPLDHTLLSPPNIPVKQPETTLPFTQHRPSSPSYSLMTLEKSTQPQSDNNRLISQPQANNRLTSLAHSLTTKVTDFVNSDSESIAAKLRKIDSDSVYNISTVNNKQTEQNTGPIEYEGFAAYLAARIRTKAELKQVGPVDHMAFPQQSQFRSPTPGSSIVSASNSSVQSPRTTPSTPVVFSPPPPTAQQPSVPTGEAAVSNQTGTTPQSNSGTGSENSSRGSPPKLLRERGNAVPPRRRLFSRPEEEIGSSVPSAPVRDPSGLRSSSETSVFDFKDSDSEGEMPVLERQTLDEMRRDRKSHAKQAVTSTTAITTSSDSVAEPSVEEVKTKESVKCLDTWNNTCDKFMEQLRVGGDKIKRTIKKIPKAEEKEKSAKRESCEALNKTPNEGSEKEKPVTGKRKKKVKCDKKEDKINNQEEKKKQGDKKKKLGAKKYKIESEVKVSDKSQVNKEIAKITVSKENENVESNICSEVKREVGDEIKGENEPSTNLEKKSKDNCVQIKMEATCEGINNTLPFREASKISVIKVKEEVDDTVLENKCLQRETSIQEKNNNKQNELLEVSNVQEIKIEENCSEKHAAAYPVVKQEKPSKQELDRELLRLKVKEQLKRRLKKEKIKKKLRKEKIRRKKIREKIRRKKALKEQAAKEKLLAVDTVTQRPENEKLLFSKSNMPISISENSIRKCFTEESSLKKKSTQKVVLQKEESDEDLPLLRSTRGRPRKSPKKEKESDKDIEDEITLAEIQARLVKLDTNKKELSQSNLKESEKDTVKETPVGNEEGESGMTLRSKNVTSPMKSSPEAKKRTSSPQKSPYKSTKKSQFDHFYQPGWEEELYNYKRSLRMPERLINISRPYRLSASLPDLDRKSSSPLYPDDLPDPSSKQQPKEVENSRRASSAARSESVSSDSEPTCRLFGLYSKTREKKTASVVNLLTNKFKENSADVLNENITCDMLSSNKVNENKNANKKVPMKKQPLSTRSSVLDIGLNHKGTNNGDMSNAKGKIGKKCLKNNQGKKNLKKVQSKKISENVVYNRSSERICDIKKSVAIDSFYNKALDIHKTFQDNGKNLPGVYGPLLLKARLKTCERELCSKLDIDDMLGTNRSASAPPSYRDSDEKDSDSDTKVKLLDKIKKEQEELKTIKVKDKKGGKLSAGKFVKRKERFIIGSCETGRRQLIKRSGLRSAGIPVVNKIITKVKKRRLFLNGRSHLNHIVPGENETIPNSSEELKNAENVISIRKSTKGIRLRPNRRKFRSGFDYIRKKKKKLPSKEGSLMLKEKKRRKRKAKRKIPQSLEDIQNEIKGWVINKGLGETPLHRAARLGYSDIAAFCLEKLGHSPSPTDNAGYTPLHEACSRGHLEVATILLQYGADVSACAPGGVRPLHEACDNGHVEVVRLLLSYGADPLVATYSGNTPFSLSSNERTLKLMQHHLADIQGMAAPAWCFRGPSFTFDRKRLSANPLQDPPSPKTDIPEDETLDFESSDNPMPVVYRLRNDPANDEWVLLQELTTLYRVKSRETLLRQLNMPAKDVIRELKMNDFLEHARSLHVQGMCEKFNVRASKVVMVKYNDKVRELLGIEKVSISCR